MSRLRNFSRSLATSYLQLVVNVLYSLASVPLILHWLSTDEFGLWTLLVQLMSYLFLIDLGINQAISRFLIDHKDSRHSGEYGALVKTSFLVSAAQGAIVLALVLFGSPLLATLMNIPLKHAALFVSLMRWQGLIVAFNFCMNPLNIMLMAQQRTDVISRLSIYNLILNLAMLGFLLARGVGIYSFIYATAATAVLTSLQLFWHCRRLGFMPHGSGWGRTNWAQFKEVFFYGKDVFLINLGGQLITASQTIIVSRMLGLEAAAAWSVGTKVMMLIRQITFQPYSAAAAGLSEMLARGETERLRLRFKNLVSLIASLGAYCGVTYVLCNSLFVEIWTRGKITWSPKYDVLLALWLFFTAMQAPHCNFVFVTKQVANMRFIYFAEGCCFVLLSMLVGWRFGFIGIIVCSVACSTLFSYNLGLRLSRRYFNVSLWELALDWVRPALKLALILTLLAVALWAATASLPTVWRLAIHATVMGTVGAVLFLRFGLSSQMIQDSAGRLPRPAARILERLVS
ncbi:MAG: oligosaccharide flippase family protein [Verrucomicrobiota bacterium]